MRYGHAHHAQPQRHHRAPRRAHDPRRRECGTAAGQPRRADRAQRRRQVHHGARHRGPAGAGRRHARHAARRAYRLYRAGGPRGRRHPVRDGAGRRHRTRRADGGGGRARGRGWRHGPAGRRARAADRDRRLCRAGTRGAHPGRPGLRRGHAAAPPRQLLGRVEDARGAGRAAVLAARPAAARRAVEPPRPGSGDVAGGFPSIVSRDHRRGQPRTRLPQQRGRSYPASAGRQDHALPRRL